MPIEIDNDNVSDLDTKRKAKGGKDYRPSREMVAKEQTTARAAIEKAIKSKPPEIHEPRCHVCTSPYRHHIEKLLAAKGANYVWISENIPGKDGTKIDRRSVSTHAKRHMSYDSAAIRAILEAEAEASAQNFEEGVRGAITHRGVLEVALRKAFEDIANGTTTVEPRDLIAIVNQIEKMDERTEQVAVNQLRAQVNAFVEAIRAETDPDTWDRIFKRFRGIMEEDGNVLPPGEIVDAEVVG